MIKSNFLERNLELTMLRTKMVKVFGLSANFLAKSVILMKRRSPPKSLNYFIFECTIAAIRSPLYLKPYPENVIKLTIKGLFSALLT